MPTICARRRLVLPALFIAVMGALGGCAPLEAWRRCGGSCPGDAELATAVRARLAEHTELRAPNQVDVRVIEGIVYLSGQVSTELQRDDAEQIAGQTPGVRHVVDIIGVEYRGW